MPEERITLKFKEKKVVWNREVLYQDYDIANSRAFIIAGNESSWLRRLEDKYFTPDFYVMLAFFDLTSVTLYIKYGQDAPMKWKCSGSPLFGCFQALDGIYNTQEECKAACRTPPPPAPTDKFFTCMNGRCQEVNYVTEFKNDPTCGGKCGTTPCTNGRTLTTPCPDNPDKKKIQTCIEGTWITTEDQCADNTMMLAVLAILIVVLFFVALRRK